MSFFKKLKELFSGSSEDIEEQKQESLAKETVAHYNASVQPEEKPKETLAQKIQSNQSVKTQPTQTVYQQPVQTVAPQYHAVREAVEYEEPSVSDVVEHQVLNAQLSRLDLLIDALDLDARKIVFDRGVVTIPFDASGCDFDTKRQLTAAVADEYGVDYRALPNGIAVTEMAKKIFSCLKGAREECFACGSLFAAVNPDIDEEGYVVGELTNIANGNSVFFDIPAVIKDDGNIDVNYDTICSDLMIAKNKIAHNNPNL